MDWTGLDWTGLYLFGLGVLVLGKELVGQGALVKGQRDDDMRIGRAGQGRTDLEGAAHAEDTVVGLLGREALEGEKDDIGLFGDQVIGSVGKEKRSARAQGRRR